MKDEFIHFDDAKEARDKFNALVEKDGVYSVSMSVVVTSSDYDKGSFIVNWSEE